MVITLVHVSDAFCVHITVCADKQESCKVYWRFSFYLFYYAVVWGSTVHMMLLGTPLAMSESFQYAKTENKIRIKNEKKKKSEK